MIVNNNVPTLKKNGQPFSNPHFKHHTSVLIVEYPHVKISLKLFLLKDYI